MRIAIALFEEAEELDWAGPWEVLAMWAQEFPGDGVAVFTVADTLEPITCAKGLRVVADRTWDEAGSIDVLVVPGGDGTRPLLGDKRWRERLRSLSNGGALVTSVCTGALVLADASLLDSRPATTYWQQLDLLASLGTDIDARPDDRFVDDGNVVTAAGVSAGIDMSLHLVARLHWAERAPGAARDPVRPRTAGIEGAAGRLLAPPARSISVARRRGRAPARERFRRTRW
jgi:transcriptional regulator GlxA family with amidase domain